MFILSTVKKYARTDQIAAVGKEGELSYAALEARSEALAVFLLDRYPGKAPIILWGDKEHDMLTGVLAALKSGKPYVMVPSFYPQLRVQAMLDSCEPCAVFSVCEIPFLGSGYDLYGKTAIDAICAEYAGIAVDPSSSVGEDEMVCLFFTSGSTGSPKGVAVTRRNIEEFARWSFPCLVSGIDKPRFLNFAPYSFSASIYTIYNGLGVLGATLYAVDRELTSDYPHLLEFIYKTDPHIMACTPSFAQICLLDPRFSAENMPSLLRLTVAGEPCPHRIGEMLLKRFPASRIIISYGATETTLGTITCDLSWDMINSDKPLPIGYTYANSRIRIVDEAGRDLPDGKVGELIIISDMITAGYYKDPERTAKSYFVAEDGMRGFRTRDMVWRENGLIYYVGRADNMVKVGGYRVEMEEVERFLLQVSAVAKCAVAPAEEDQRTVMLVAYVVLKSGVPKGIQTTITIKNEISKWVQAYMIPQKIVYLDNLPFTQTARSTAGCCERCRR